MPSGAQALELEARIKAYEMAAKLQLSAPEATAITGESKATQKLYQLADEDIGPFGRQCLLARRLVERGVRFVQIFVGRKTPRPARSGPTGTATRIFRAITATGAACSMAALLRSSKI